MGQPGKAAPRAYENTPGPAFLAAESEASHRGAVSIGHRVDLHTAAALVLACALKYRLPEPTRLADRLVAAAKQVD